jgi:hypothetical protein
MRGFLARFRSLQPLPRLEKISPAHITRQTCTGATARHPYRRNMGLQANFHELLLQRQPAVAASDHIESGFERR